MGIGSIIGKVAGPVLGSVLGGFIGSDGAKDAARTSAQGSQAALQENGRQFDLSMLANLLLNAPTINSGNTARSTLMSMLGMSTPGVNYNKFAKGLGGAGGQGAGGSLADAFSLLNAPGSKATGANRQFRQLANTPGFQFVKDQAMDTIMGNSRALGLGKSGATVQSVGDTIGQGIAFPMYNSYLDRLAGLAGAGSGSSAGLASNIGSLATNSGALNAGLIQNQADSRASGTLGQAGAWQGTLNNLGTIAGDYFGKKRNTGGAAYDNYYGTDIF